MILDAKGKPIARYIENYATGFVDSWNKQKEPSDRGLVKEYENVAYACANINATAVSTVPLRLYVRNRNGQQTRFWETRRLTNGQQKHIRTKLRLTSGDNVEEVVEHPVLDLLCNPNAQLDFCQLLEITQLFQEISGTAYWYVVKDKLGRPQNVFYLLSQWMNPVRDTSGKIVAFDYGHSTNYRRFELSELIVFAMPNLTDEVLGYSPLRAIWESVNLASKIDATQAAMLDNNARPDLIVSPKGDGYMGEHEKARYEARFNQKFSRAGSGGVLFLDEDANVMPLNFSPKDLSVLQFKQVSKIDIANAFGVPMAMLETSAVNRANLEGSRMQHALNAITPRIKRLEARLNKFLVSQYDDSGRLFLAFDDPSPENRQEKQAELTGYVGANIITKNEARYELGLPEHPDGNNLVEPMPGLDMPKTGDDDKPEAEPEAPEADKPENVPTTALNGGQIQNLVAIVQQVTEGLLPIDTARAIIAASFPTLDGAAIDAIVKPLLTFEPEKPEAPEADDEGDDDEPDPDDTPPDNEPEPPDDDDTPKPKLWLPGNVEHAIAKAARDREQDALGSIPDGKRLAAVVSRFFRQKGKVILAQLGKGFKARKQLPEQFVGLDEWTDELAEQCRPLIELYITKSGQNLMGRVGASPDAFNVTNPKVRDAIENATFAFAESTLATTTKQLNVALADLRESLGSGLDAGERISELTDRVQHIFTEMADYGAERIARTEASRGHHAGFEMAAEQSGVVAGKRWLVSPHDPDGRCAAYKDKAVGLGKNFDVINSGNPAYNEIPFPPLHPNCKCTVVEVLDIEAEQYGLPGYTKPQQAEQTKPLTASRPEGTPEPRKATITQIATMTHDQLADYLLEFRGDVSKEFGDKMRDGLKALPEEHLRVMALKKQAVVTGALVSDVMPELKGVRPRGWPAGSTWDNAEGLYAPKQKQIVMTEYRIDRETRKRIKARPETARILAHEAGHALDAAAIGGRTTATQEYQDIYAKEIKEALKENGSSLRPFRLKGDTVNFGYVLQPKYGKISDGGYSESFAEGYAALYGGSMTGPAFDRLTPKTQKAITDTIDATRKRLQEVIDQELADPGSVQREVDKQEAERQQHEQLQEEIRRELERLRREGLR